MNSFWKKKTTRKPHIQDLVLANQELIIPTAVMTQMCLGYGQRNSSGTKGERQKNGKKFETNDS